MGNLLGAGLASLGVLVTKPRLLDLFAGAGGAARGYQQAGFYVVGVDHKPQPRYAGDEFIQADAMTYPLEGFDVIHASPPCQGYIQRNKNLETRHPKLIEPLRERLSGKPYVIENVTGAARHLHHPVMLCGTMFGLPVLRHRLFEVWEPQLIARPKACCHRGTVANGDYAAVYAFGGKGPRRGYGVPRTASPVAVGPDWGDALGIDWMTKPELSQAIPPAYTAYIGEQLMSVLRREA